MSKRERKYREYAYKWKPIMGMDNLQVSLDGATTWISAKENCVKASDPEVADEVFLTVTNEGVKAEVVCDNETLGSEMKHYTDIIADLE